MRRRRTGLSSLFDDKLMTTRLHAIAARITLTYALFATAWIVLSDGMNAWLWDQPAMDWLRNSSKGLGFVAVTSLLLFGMMRRHYQRFAKQEVRLRATEEWWRFAVHNAGHGVWDWNAKDGRVYYSKQWKSMLGFRESEVSERHEEWLERLHPEDRPRVEETMRLHMEGKIPTYASEYRLRTKRGEWKWILARGQITERSGDGKPLRAIGTQTDITRLKEAEQELKTNQQRLELALEAANQGLYDVNIPTGEIVVNETYARIIGEEPATFKESEAAALERMHPDDRERAHQTYRDYMEGRIPDYRVEFRQRRKDGQWRWILSLGRVVERDAQGRPLRMLGTHTDITEQKSAQARSADALAFAKMVFHSSPVGIITYGPDGRTVTANQAAARIVGAEVAQLLRQNYRELESWRRSGLLAAAERAVAEGHEVVHTGPLTTTFGKSLWVEAHFVPFDYVGEKHLLLILSEETEKRQAAENLQLLYTAVQAAPVGWVVTDAEGRIQSVNPAFTMLTGYEAAEVVGQSPRLLKSGRHTPEFYADMWRTIKAGAVWTGEMINRRKDGTEYREHMTIAPVRNPEGSIEHYVAVKQDITERRSLEQQLARSQRLEGIGMLASGIAHDLNNIFAPILLSLEMLKMKYPSADDRRMVELIESAGQRGAGIVRQVLTFARGLEGERTEINPRYLIKEAAQIFGETLPRQIQIETDVPAELPSVRGDATQLHQVLLNLAINARDAMPDGGRLVLGARPVEVDAAPPSANPALKTGRWVVLTVRDTGVGMSPRVQERIFEPFFTTKPLGQGTGLGLSTVYGIVRSHGGAVEVSSEVGRGAEFRVWLPAVVVKTPVSGCAAGANGVEPLRGDGRQVLVVDDEEAIRLVTRAALERHGFEVVTARDGAEGWALFQASPTRFCAAVIDLMMPRMNGRQLVRQMRELAPDLPVIFSSGLTDEKDGSAPQLSFEALRAKTLLRKPYNEAQLLATLREALADEVVVEKKV
jgi:two-component system, cell cycle sensor histidine kinase and response regulator CckA